jgi:hypothetical protein
VSPARAAAIALLDANVLIALAVLEHVHHDAAERWFVGLSGDHASCPITQAALVRFLLRHGRTTEQAMTQLAGMTAHRRHRFWPAAIGFGEVAMGGVVGHRQVTEAYLAALARHHRGRLATLDAGLAQQHPDVAVLIPIGG